MSTQEFENEMHECKLRLGQLIKECHGTMSQRKLAAQAGLVPSHMKSIEDGVHAPTPEVYDKLIATLKPDEVIRSEMDALYMEIRRLPPPDICKWIINNPCMLRVIRRVAAEKLTFEQYDMIDTVFQAVEAEQASHRANND